MTWRTQCPYTYEDKYITAQSNFYQKKTTLIHTDNMIKEEYIANNYKTNPRTEVLYKRETAHYHS